MNLGLASKKALVSGGSRGIGLHIGMQLAAEGCEVAFCARSAGGVETAIEQINQAGGPPAHGFVADLADEAATREFARQAISVMGGLDLLIHNASGFGGSDEAGWLQSFQVDMMAGVRLVEESLESLKQSDAASITFIGSMASKFHFGRPPGSYGAAKGAMRVYANELAQSYGRHGIRANVLSPGAVWFEGGSWDQQKQNNPKFYAAVEKAIPLGRLGTAEEIARAVAFVASPAGLWINATHIAIDGGQVAAVD